MGVTLSRPITTKHIERYVGVFRVCACSCGVCLTARAWHRKGTEWWKISAASMWGRRTDMEDEHIIVPRIGDATCLVGVFDGHAGMMARDKQHDAMNCEFVQSRSGSCCLMD